MAKFLKFPSDFLWGASTSAYQIEGGWNEDGRAESIWDRFAHSPGHTKGSADGDTACDHYHRFQDDVGLMRELGLSAYRFSISWPRVLPEGRGTSNRMGLDFYSRLVDALLEKNITPIITLYHWDLPQAIQDAGGWLNRRTIDWFVEYASLMYKTLGDRVIWWTTFNEPMVCAELGFEKGTHAPGVRDKATSLQVFHHILVAHGDAVAAGRPIIPKGKLGIAPALLMAYPATDSDTDRAAAETAWQHADAYQLDPVLRGCYPETVRAGMVRSAVFPTVLSGDMERICQPIDYLGVNHYFSFFFTPAGNGTVKYIKTDKVTERSDLDWPVYPPGLTELLLRLKNDYGTIPIIITENGLSLNDTIAPDGEVHDPRRISCLRGFLKATYNALSLGVDIRGYCHWSLMDNFEWAYGYEPRFGLTYVDYPTQRRVIKDSGREYAKIIEAGGLEG